MSRQDLQEAIKRLRTEVENLADDEINAKRRLRDLISDLEQQLKSPGDSAHERSLVSGLQQSIEQFEVEHPRITGVLNHIMVTLANMGI